MAIKIDLLPGYVRLGRQRNLALIVSAIVLVLAGSGLAVLQEQKRLELAKITTDRDMYRAIAQKTTTAKNNAAQADTESQPFVNAIDFMSGASKSGAERAALLNLVRQYIYENSLVTSIDISDGRNVTIKGTVRDPEEYARFLLNLRRASDVNGGLLFTGLPSASGPGGFANGARPFQLPEPDANGQPIVILYPIEVTAVGVLKNPVVLPVDPTLGAAPATAGGIPGTPGLPGGPPGIPGGAPGAPGGAPRP